jgi:hypothetical protein
VCGGGDDETGEEGVPTAGRGEAVAALGKSDECGRRAGRMAEYIGRVSRGGFIGPPAG